MRKLTTLPWHWLPPLITLSMVMSLHIDVPYHDQWDLLELLHAYYQQTLQWKDLLTPHNGHILFLPKLVMLSLAVLTKWNTLAEVLFSFICMLMNWLLLQKMACYLLMRQLLRLENFALSALVFSLSQAQNWLWGWQLQIPLALLFILAGMNSLLYVKNSVLAFLLSCCCGAAASLCFAGSLPFWLATIPLIWQRNRYYLIPWIVVSLISIVFFATKSIPSMSSIAPSNAINATEIVRHISNTAALLGNLVARFNMPAAMLAGIAAAVIVVANFPNLTEKQRGLVLTILLFCSGSALMVSLSRAGISDDMMLASRYGTLMLPLWALSTILALQHIKFWRQFSVWHLSALALSLSLLASELNSLKEWQQLHNRLLKGSYALANIDTDEGQARIGVINPRKDRAQAVTEAMMLRHYQLSFYRKSEP